jgi:uncharacterized membrane protein
MLLMVRAGVSRSAALIAAGILALAESQIRYAQEVREYSLSVLFATIVIYFLLRWDNADSRSSHPLWLYSSLFIVPLVQYGLVFFAVGVLGAMFLRVMLTRDITIRYLHVAIASFALIAGGMLSYFLTARYQYRVGATQWYLAADYFDSKGSSVASFIAKNTMDLLSFAFAGRVACLCIVFGAVLYCITQIRDRRFETITLVTFSCVLIVVCTSLARVYPYGGIRQCLFLSPLLALFAGCSLASLLQPLRPNLRPIAAAVILAIISLSLLRTMRHSSPYEEFEDTKSVIRELAQSCEPSDQVWVNHDIVPPFQFYFPAKDQRFVYGKVHADPKEDLQQLFGAIDPHTDRLWLVFSHMADGPAGEKLIVKALQPDWDAKQVMSATNVALYLARRKTT